MAILYGKACNDLWLSPLHLEVLELGVVEDRATDVQRRRDRVVKLASERGHDAVHLMYLSQEMRGIPRVPIAWLVANLDADAQPGGFLEKGDEAQVTTDQVSVADD